MQPVSEENKIFEKQLYFEENVEGNFDKCQFVHCDFSEAKIQHSNFYECEFKHCNFSNAKVIRTSFTDCKFSDSKLIGITFDLCGDFYYTVDFNKCQFDYASLYKLNLRNAHFLHCNFRETDFSETDFHTALFDVCEFTGAHFENTNLEWADLRTSRNYLIDPDRNKIRKAKFSMPHALGLLYKYDISIE
ncbi:MAG: pentapeptide repeat-containing protein [Saprospiraceae bacterium]